MNSAILLAAGTSSRMGELKALLPWGSSTLLAEQIRHIARSTIDELVIIVGFQKERLLSVIQSLQIELASHIHMKIICNEEYMQGKTSSIRLGIQHLAKKSKALCIIGVDQPVQANTLVELFSNVQDKEIRVPTYQNRKGHPPLFTWHFYNDISSISEKKEGLREVVQRYKKHINYIPVKEPQVLLNFNRKEDYQKAKEKNLDNYSKTR
jgi:molybdenum cofactor cytidylyltransferase